MPPGPGAPSLRAGKCSWAFFYTYDRGYIIEFSRIVHSIWDGLWEKGLLGSRSDPLVEPSGRTLWSNPLVPFVFSKQTSTREWAAGPFVMQRQCVDDSSEERGRGGMRWLGGGEDATAPFKNFTQSRPRSRREPSMAMEVRVRTRICASPT